MDGFKRRTQAKKQNIIDVASALFFAKGPSKTTIAEIAQKAGVSQVTIYNYFANKDALLEHIVHEHLDFSLQKAEQVLEMNVPFKVKMEHFFSLGENTKNEISEESLSNFDWKNQKVQAIYNKFLIERQIPFLIRFVELGKAEGAIKKDLSNEAIMAYLQANTSIYRDPALLSKGKQFLASLSHLFFYGLLGK